LEDNLRVSVDIKLPE